MGRKKIEIKQIIDKRSRKDVFYKRKVGLVKKAAELAMLCNVRMLLVFEDLAGEIIKFSAHGIYNPIEYFEEKFVQSKFEFTSADYPDFFKGSAANKKQKAADMHFEDDNDSEEESGPQEDHQHANIKELNTPSFNMNSNIKLIQSA